MVTRLDTGEVAALVGGRRPRYAGFNRALDARRPAGSLLKPAIYLTALEQPRRYTLASVLDDSALTRELDGDAVWEPRNFDRQTHGDVLLYNALAQSYNLATARLGLEWALAWLPWSRLWAGWGQRRRLAGARAHTGGRGIFTAVHGRMYQAIAAGGYRLPLRSIRDVSMPAARFSRAT